MKKILIYTMAMLALSTTFTSCKDADEEELWISSPARYMPVVISVRVLSPKGYSILNASNSKNITVTFRGETFECDKLSRVYIPTFYGLKRNNDILLFGELGGDQTYENEQVIFSWGDDIKPDTITFTHIPLQMQSDPAGDLPCVEEHLFVNGEEVKSTEGGWGFLNESAVGVTFYKDLNSSFETFTFETPATDEIRNMPLTMSEKAIFYCNTQIAMHLLNNLSKQGKYTTIYSPLSLFNACGILANGISDDSKKDRDVFGMAMGKSSDDVINFPDINHIFKTVNSFLPLVDHSVYASAPTALFMDNQYILYKGFVDLIAENYKSDYYLIGDVPSGTGGSSIKKDEAMLAMNEWRSQKTQGTSKAFISTDGTNTLSNMADVLSVSVFKADWTQGFNPELTEMADFTTTNGTPIQVRMMHGQFNARYSAKGYFDYLELPLGHEAWEMVVIYKIFLTARTPY